MSAQVTPYARVRFTGFAGAHVHFIAPWVETTCCGMESGPNREDHPDGPVTCEECVRRAWATFRWWFPRKSLPAWLAGAGSALRLK